MRQSLIDRLSIVTEEENNYLGGKQIIEKSKYFSADSSIVSGERLFLAGEGKREKRQIEIRTHTRFIDFPIHGHDYIEMMYVCNGSITHVIDDKEITLRKGGILLMNRHVKHAIKKAGRNDIGVNFIISSALFESVIGEVNETNVFADFIIENLRNTGKPVSLQLNIDGVLPIENLMENLLYSIIHNEGSEVHILQKTMSLMLSYFVSFDGILVNKIFTDDYAERLKNAVRSYVRTDYCDASLTVLAERLSMSHTYLCKWISANMHTSFKEMVVDQRFKVAESLLKTTDLSVADIASAVGYENASYFYRQFRKRFGKTPRTVRRE